MQTNTFFLKASYDEDIRIDINEDVLERIYADNISNTDKLNINFAFITDTQDKADRFAKNIHLSFPIYQDVQAEPYDDLFQITGITEPILMHIDAINKWNQLMWEFGYKYDCKLDGWEVGT